MSRDWLPDRAVLFTVGAGLVAVLFAIVIGIFNVDPVPAGAEGIPNWAENVLVAMATGALLKIGDVISAVVALSSNRQVERLGTQLGQSSPLGDVPQPVVIDQPPGKPVPVDQQP
ncbi:hypothetical protein sphantq_02922 [Sphingobium sp. AntQ-1]|uniref:hypothetical protein n=1 Tax=Sphingobium sp. AntQ-1 TaxID=2930091 RepID=UPI00234EAC47|nr:hypothetical protein [Sphingobium sp. AntQ-1]WCP14476.1 hypothetical protein sphantq_02922 [Sphingobium sp. AntQ-1]